MKYQIAFYINRKILKSRTRVFIFSIFLTLAISISTIFVVTKCIYDQALSLSTLYIHHELNFFEKLIDLYYPGEWEIRDGKLYKDGIQINHNYQIVDLFEKLSGDTATIFQNDTRVTTTIRDSSGKRIIGTRVSKPVAKRVLVEGKDYYGIADILGKKYITAYRPIKDKNGNIIGILYTGVPLSYFDDIKRKLYFIIGVPYLLLVIIFIITIFFILQWAKTQSLSITDPLTEIYNRRYFIERLKTEMERAKRYNIPLSLIIIDLDDFKKINDTYGHMVGDKVLKAVAQTLKNRLRKTDILARWGGEEFIILLPNTPPEKAVFLAGDLRKKIEEMKIPGVKKITASFGITGYCIGDDINSLIKRADDAMYEVKK
ncbi:sensor domain-containing diguanylate cyclase [Thermodesulfobacterium hydrogeniphilum]|uniref:sensor domain-containing diguanylate cyclase n=1 Tax=Thermodesulfobacterium hydrogeniphilum TaxID=161156 RepID=UPI00068D6807|nr:diguanylate cyclase [Thermodesulfobacterium hydrogeniphilum]